MFNRINRKWLGLGLMAMALALPLERRSAYYHLLRFGLYFMESRRPDIYIAGSMPNSLHACVQ